MSINNKPKHCSVTKMNIIPLLIQYNSFQVLKNFSVGRVIYIKATAPSGRDIQIDLYLLSPQYTKSKYWWPGVSLIIHTRLRATTPGVNQTSYKGVGLVAGEQFQLTIIAQQFGFEIGVNGRHFANYTYHLPPSNNITVMLTNVPAIETIGYYPSAQTQHCRATPCT